jgi:hypothetical protein
MLEMERRTRKGARRARRKIRRKKREGEAR